MKNQDKSGVSLKARIFAGVMAGILLLGTILGVLLYFN